jgi:hypothetical protein
MIKIQIVPGTVAFYDELTRIHLTLSNPRAEVPEDADLSNIKNGIRVGTINLIEGSLDGDQEDAEQDNKEEAEKEPDNKKYTYEELDELYVKDLKEIAKDEELSGYSSMKKEDIKLEIDDDYLTISAEHQEEKEEKNDNYIHRERRQGRYTRRFHLQNVDQNDINAEYDDGILKVHLPKEEKTPVKKRTIEIE